MSGNPTILLIGGGGHAAVVAETVQALGWRIAGFLDDDPATELIAASIPMKRLGAINDLSRIVQSQPGTVITHAATGDPELRTRWLDASEELGLGVDPIVHPSAIVSPSARLDRGVYVAPMAIVNARAGVGRGAIINSGAIVEHDVEVGAWAHLAPGSVVAGGARVGDAALVGCRAVVLPGISIGRAATLGAGAVATADVPDGMTAVGVPARALVAQEPL